MAWMKCRFSDTRDKTDRHRTKAELDYIYTYKSRAQVETIRVETGNPNGRETDKWKR